VRRRRWCGSGCLERREACGEETVGRRYEGEGKRKDVCIGVGLLIYEITGNARM
jgi:hypothetical protein